MNHLLANETNKQYTDAFGKCKNIFLKKTKDYGTSWRVLRSKSITDQIFIKAQRIRSIEEKGIQKVDESIEHDFMAMVNYGIIALIQLELGDNGELELSLEKAEKLFDKKMDEVQKLMLNKNHDYGEAWRDMRVSSFTDLILMKLQRIKQIEDNDGKTIISEGIGSHFSDIVNYAIFALIKLKEANR